MFLLEFYQNLEYNIRVHIFKRLEVSGFLKRFFHFVKQSVRELDKFLLSLCIVTSAFGILMVYSATRHSLTDGAVLPRDVLTMLVAVGAGLIICLIISHIDYEIILKCSPLIGLACLALMASLFIWGVGPQERSDAKTWIRLGSFYFQPSELLKIGFVLTFATHLGFLREKLNSFKNIVLLGVHAIIPVGLVAVTGDDGSALVFIVIILVMLFIAGVYWRYFAIGFSALIIVVPIMWVKYFTSFQQQRFLALVFPEKYPDIIYQQQRCIEAIGSGQWFGKGLFKGDYTQTGAVPESQNDMVFSVIGEEFGLIGCVLALLLLTLIVVRIVKIGKKTNDKQALYVCYGIAVMIAAQVIINVGMCLKLLPVIGITLPFFSAGGSSNLCVYIGIGLILSIHRYTQEKEIVNFKMRNIRTPFAELY